MNKLINFITGKNKKEMKKKMPKLNENLKVCGRLKMTGRDKTGKILWIKEQDNLITNAGFDLIADVIGLDAQPSDITHMAVGTGAVGTAAATALTTETLRSAATYAHTAGTKTFTLTATFTDPAAIIEYGCLNAATAGVLLNTAGFAAITVSSLEIVATFTLS